MYRVTETFKDWDERTIREGETADDLVLCGFSERHQQHFWNLVKDGRVLAVTLGRPPAVRVA